jgi:hypothetical protein
LRKRLLPIDDSADLIREFQARCALAAGRAWHRFC